VFQSLPDFFTAENATYIQELANQNKAIDFKRKLYKFMHDNAELNFLPYRGKNVSS
jgi:hypothetical protein